MAIAPQDVATLAQKRQILLLGEVNSQMQEMFCTLLLLLNAQNNSPITVCFDSVGGSLNMALHMMDAVRHSAAPVIGLVTATAQSAAFDILQVCTKRQAYVHATLMTHSTEIRVRLNRPDFDAYVRESRAQSAELVDIFLERSKGKLSRKQLLKWMLQEKRLTAREALKAGLIDKII